MEVLNPVSVYQMLTQNKKIELTQTRLEQFVSNIVSSADGQPFPEYTIKGNYIYRNYSNSIVRKPFPVGTLSDGLAE